MNRFVTQALQQQHLVALQSLTPSSSSSSHGPPSTPPSTHSRSRVGSHRSFSRPSSGGALVGCCAYDAGCRSLDRDSLVRSGSQHSTNSGGSEQGTSCQSRFSEQGSEHGNSMRGWLQCSTTQPWPPAPISAVAQASLAQGDQTSSANIMLSTAATDGVWTAFPAGIAVERSPVRGMPEVTPMASAVRAVPLHPSGGLPSASPVTGVTTAKDLCCSMSRDEQRQKLDELWGEADQQGEQHCTSEYCTRAGTSADAAIAAGPHHAPCDTRALMRSAPPCVTPATPLPPTSGAIADAGMFLANTLNAALQQPNNTQQTALLARATSQYSQTTGLQSATMLSAPPPRPLNIWSPSLPSSLTPNDVAADQLLLQGSATPPAALPTPRISDVQLMSWQTMLQGLPVPPQQPITRRPTSQCPQSMISLQPMPINSRASSSHSHAQMAMARNGRTDAPSRELLGAPARRGRRLEANVKKLCAIDEVGMRAGLDVRTTLHVANIPNKLTQQQLLELFLTNHDGRIDFFYLPVDFRNDGNLGYAFVNFARQEYGRVLLPTRP